MHRNGATVFYTATPSYDGINLITTEVTVRAFTITPDGPMPIALPDGGVVPNS